MFFTHFDIGYLPSYFILVSLILTPFALTKWLTQIFVYCNRFRQRFKRTGSVWNPYEIGTDKPCVYTRTGGSGTDRICYLVPNGSTYEGNPIWNPTVPVTNRSRVNRVDPYISGSDSKRI